LIKSALVNEEASKLFARHPNPDFIACQHGGREDLIDNGISEDADLRLFEVGWRGEVVTAWTDKPLSLTTDPTLVGKWAELQADLAAQVVRDAIGRAGGQR
jgi:hypothetical protein